jgi:hypothetical protein
MGMNRFDDPRSQNSTNELHALHVRSGVDHHLLLPLFQVKYLQQGNTQLRVDERSGRTDRRTDNGWIPISFDRPATRVADNQLKHVSASLVEKDIFDRIALANAATQSTTIRNSSSRNCGCFYPLQKQQKTRLPYSFPSNHRMAALRP